MKETPRFFLGANSKNGFVSYFDGLQEKSNNLQLLILKGGPGSGKSSLMKKVLQYADDKGNMTEIIPCASDPQSLDAVIDYTAGFAIMDGTAPHTLDPHIPGARGHIMYTGDMWDCGKLSKNTDNIEKLTETIGDCHKGASSYIRAAAALLDENSYLSGKYVDKHAATEVLEEIISNLKGGKEFKEKKRLLSAVTTGQIKAFYNTPHLYCDKTYVIHDNFGGFADYILKTVYEWAILKNEEIILCPCSLNPNKIDHIIFPKSRIAILKSNDFLKFDGDEKTDAMEFYSSVPMPRIMETRLKKAAELLSEAGSLISDAKFLHDELEAFYVAAMNFKLADGFFKEIKKRFYK